MGGWTVRWIDTSMNPLMSKIRPKDVPSSRKHELKPLCHDSPRPGPTAAVRTSDVNSGGGGRGGGGGGGDSEPEGGEGGAVVVTTTLLAIILYDDDEANPNINPESCCQNRQKTNNKRWEKWKLGSSTPQECGYE